MFILRHVFFLIILCISSPSIAQQINGVESYLSGRIPVQDKRYNSFLYALTLMKEYDAKILLETGTARDGDANFLGDGGATIIFGHFAKETDGLLFTVDISPDAIARAQKATQAYSDHINYIVSDSLQFLADFQGLIDFLYLDSLDYWPNPEVSQHHHLQEIILALPHLHEKSIVMIDDCGLPGGGKGLLVINFLKSHGWNVVFEGYQIIMQKS